MTSISSWKTTEWRVRKCTSPGPGYPQRQSCQLSRLTWCENLWHWQRLIDALKSMDLFICFSFSFYSHCFLTGYFTDQLTFPSKTFRLVIDELLTICLHVLVDKPEKNMNVLKRHYVTRISLKMYNNIKYNINRLLYTSKNPGKMHIGICITGS